ncbi:MAG: Proline--tRNA ligase [candidate division TA06 bacterium 32_111]|uniref:Proline--tRNA ligase n=2 Tax=Bacteria candidate phyla TaxID=1783234 RepID=A0A101I3L2_UNCT6|nr:MAG: Proline--tRNA ligase [candidate division TA06 bacterium 32_111]KUK88028.1 MAG: Proline--tRNA ligase [candidate division TA06 bacterium 34_109]HAF06956.1 proline--tRNA ligase [candidate division WOR-3 bacterium]HCP16870.1 proline--tRNA ligase [candidate division WOR-3 bacterium]
MKLTRFLFNSLKEIPKDAEIASHKLMLRGCFIRQNAAGIYSYLPLGLMVIENIRKIIKEEMDRIGGQELLLPVLTPKEIWEESGRWKDFGDEMFRVKDRKGRDFAMCPTHEEIVTDLARREIKSYRDLPQIWYQIQTKFRDEPRPRSGLLRVRQFEMKDSYSLDKDFEGLNISFEKHREAYSRIFTRCGLDFVIVEAASGLMGGRKSQEFMAFSDAGESNIVICESCNPAMNTEVARPFIEKNDDVDGQLGEVHTPVEGSVESVSDFLKINKNRLLKSILLIVKSSPVFVILPGDRDIDEDKLILIFGELFRYATDEEIEKYCNAPKGYISPVNLDIPVYADLSLKGRKGLISGANRKDFHFTNINIDRDLKNVKYIDVIKLKENDRCEKCKGKLHIKKTIEIGHIFQLGTKYSESMKAEYLTQNGERKPIVMGSYGIGLGRVASTIVEQNNDENGIIWPISVAPFKLIIIPLNVKEKKIMDEVFNLYNKFSIYDALLDDRDLTPGNKFKDADLIGIPFKIIYGNKFLNEGKVEIARRRDNQRFFVDKENVFDKINQLIIEEMERYNV